MIVYLGHQCRQLECQNFVQWKSALNNLLTYLITKQKPFFLRFPRCTSSGNGGERKLDYFLETLLNTLPPEHSIFVGEFDNSLVLEFPRPLLPQSRLPPTDDVADLVLLAQAVVDVLLDGVVAEYGEAREDDPTTADVEVERLQELADGGGAVEAHHVVGPVHHVDGHGVGEGVVVGVLQQDGQNLHAGGLGYAGPVLNAFLQGIGTVGGILPCLGSEMMKAPLRFMS